MAAKQYAPWRRFIALKGRQWLNARELMLLVRAIGQCLAYTVAYLAWKRPSSTVQWRIDEGFAQPEPALRFAT